MIAPNDEHLPPLPEWIDAKLIAETKAAWSPFYGHSLTTAEALEILLNVGRIIDALEDGTL